MAKEIIGAGRGGRTASATTGMRSRRGRSVEVHTQTSELAVELVDSDGQCIPFECFDLSTVGVYLYSDLLLEPGEIVHLRLRLPWNARPIHVHGEVVRAEPDNESQRPGMGVAFRDLGSEVVLELRKYVAKRFFRHATPR